MLAMADEHRARGFGAAARGASAGPTRSVPWRSCILLAMAAAIGVSYAWLRSEMQRVDVELQVYQRQMAAQAEELDNLRVQVEAYRSGDYILRECQRLGLHPPLPGQVRRIAVHPAPADDVSPFAESLLAQSEPEKPLNTAP